MILDVDLTKVPENTILFEICEEEASSYQRAMHVRTDENGRVTVDFGELASMQSIGFQKECLLGKRRKFAVTFDHAAGIVYGISDDIFLDGAEGNRYGWFRFSERLLEVAGAERILNKVYVKDVRIFLYRLTVNNICRDYFAN